MSTNFLPLLADRVLNRPLLIHPAKAETIYSVLEGRINLGQLSEEAEPSKPEASRFVGGYRRPSGQPTRFTRVSGHTALITVDGSLVNRGAWIGTNSGLTSYEGIAAQVDDIAADKDIHYVIVDMNSYGGEATGMAGLSGKFRALRKTKHVVALVNDVAASAGFGIAAAADRIVISPTSLVGSIGVVMLHLDRSGEMNAKGIRPTLIHAGAKKVDGNPFGPLPENVRADMQKDVMAFYDQFLSVVEAGRGKRLSAKKARATEAEVFIGKEAIEAGLADEIGSLDEVIADLSRPVRAAGKTQTKRTMKMDRENLPDANAGMHTETALRAAVNKAEEDGKAVGMSEGEKKGKAEGHAEGVTAERERIAAIVNSDEGKARPKAALTLALDEDSPKAETAIKLLGTMPEETTADANANSSKPGMDLGQRATTGQEVGATGQTEGGNLDAEAVNSGWKNATARINQRR